MAQRLARHLKILEVSVGTRERAEELAGDGHEVDVNGLGAPHAAGGHLDGAELQGLDIDDEVRRDVDGAAAAVHDQD